MEELKVSSAKLQLFPLCTSSSSFTATLGLVLRQRDAPVLPDSPSPLRLLSPLLSVRQSERPRSHLQDRS